MKIPQGLQKWFIIHFILDVSLAIPLFLAPETTLAYLGWENIDPITTRLVASALFAIGIESYLGRKSKVEAFRNMLDLKIIWSSFAIIGLMLSIAQGGHMKTILWLILIVFAIFNLSWIYWKMRLNN